MDKKNKYGIRNIIKNTLNNILNESNDKYINYIVEDLVKDTTYNEHFDLWKFPFTKKSYDTRYLEIPGHTLHNYTPLYTGLYIYSIDKYGMPYISWGDQDDERTSLLSNVWDKYRVTLLNSF